MAEQIHISKDLTKKEKYEALYSQLEVLLNVETDIVANMANLAAALKEVFDFFWVGFYVVKNDELVLAPFQGPVACTRIRFGKGVCGTSWEREQAIVVPDVEQFSGHIACSSLSRSEIVVPVIKDDKVVAILDVDSNKLDAFDNEDAQYLEKIVSLLKF
ncbi:MAG: GAF domain-containing protein [Dysgonamonadaceae bacterium]|jgi:GAF domain-containing protein|nr:GAF domain-containing protein [Dysgonamonadaceae bacterium]